MLSSFPGRRNVSPFQGCHIDTNNSILHKNNPAWLYLKTFSNFLRVHYRNLCNLHLEIPKILLLKTDLREETWKHWNVVTCFCEGNNVITTVGIFLFCFVYMMCISRRNVRMSTLSCSTFLTVLSPFSPENLDPLFPNAGHFKAERRQILTHNSSAALVLIRDGRRWHYPRDDWTLHGRSNQ